jgi:hypothetical protein
MRAARGVVAVAAGAILLLSACARDAEPNLMNIRQAGDGPDEFGILPSLPLELPTDLAALPPPTPGGVNRADPTPNADAVAALGGNPGALVARGTAVPAADGALLAQAGRYGITPGIRQTLAAEDLEFRRQNDGRLLERLFNANVYFRAYRPFALDQQRELERWRAAGVRNVSAPPPPDGN